MVKKYFKKISGLKQHDSSKLERLVHPNIKPADFHLLLMDGATLLIRHLQAHARYGVQEFFVEGFVDGFAQ